MAEECGSVIYSPASKACIPMLLHELYDVDADEICYSSDFEHWIGLDDEK